MYLGGVELEFTPQIRLLITILSFLLIGPKAIQENRTISHYGML